MIKSVIHDQQILSQTSIPAIPASRSLTFIYITSHSHSYTSLGIIILILKIGENLTNSWSNFRNI